MKFQRRLYKTLLSRIAEKRNFIQVITGPRQVGKTTIALELQKNAGCMAEYHSADDASVYGASWIDQIWDSLRIRMKFEKIECSLLILDELQKISDWSAAIKKHWDRDTREGNNIKLIILGSSRLLLMDGLSESLTGRFELNYATHWGLDEMREAFEYTNEEYQWFGGYPGAAAFIKDELRYKEYIINAIIEPTMTRDILYTTKIDKPALLRQLLEVGIGYSSQIMSYNRILGQLQDAGNTTTLVKYLRLLEQAGLLSGLNKFNNREIEIKSSIPKFQVHNSALFSATRGYLFKEAVMDRAAWGYVVENSVGAYLVNQVCQLPNTSLYYWRDNGSEIDYVIRYGSQAIGIEIKSGDESIPEKTTEKFKEFFPHAKLLLIGKHGIPYDSFMNSELKDIIAAL